MRTRTIRRLSIAIGTATDGRRTAARSRTKLSNGWFVLAVLIPISGLVLAIIEWSRGNTSRGFAFAGAGLLAFLVFALVTCASYSSCVDDARTLAQMNRC